MQASGDWIAYLGESRGASASVGFKKLIEGATKKQAHAALKSALGGSHSAILKWGHSYFAIATKKNRS